MGEVGIIEGITVGREDGNIVGFEDGNDVISEEMVSWEKM